MWKDDGTRAAAAEELTERATSQSAARSSPRSARPDAPVPANRPPGGSDVVVQGRVSDKHLAAFSGSGGATLRDSGASLSDLSLASWNRQRHILMAAASEPTYRIVGWVNPPVGSMFARGEARTEGTFVTYTSENVTPSEVLGLETPHYRYVRPTWNPTLAGTFRTPTDLTLLRIWLGFTGGHIGNRTIPTGRAVAALRHEHGLDTGWATVTCAGGAGVTIVQSQPQWSFSADTVVHWRVEISASGESVTFFIDDVPASQVHLSNVPGPQAWLGCVSQVVTMQEAVRDCGISTLVLEHD